MTATLKSFLETAEAQNGTILRSEARVTFAKHSRIDVSWDFDPHGSPLMDRPEGQINHTRIRDGSLTVRVVDWDRQDEDAEDDIVERENLTIAEAEQIIAEQTPLMSRN